jgi:hypothetical protein
MEPIKLPFGTGVYRNVDEMELNDRDAYLMNGYVDELGAIRSFPGLAEWKDLGLGIGAGIDGLYWWEDKACALAVADGKVFKLTYPNQVPTSVDLFNADRLVQNVRASICTNGTYAFLANGGKIGYTDGTADVAFLADTDAPAAVCDVAFIDNYILAFTPTAKWYWSDISPTPNPLSWNALSYASAAGDADNIVAGRVRNRQVFLFGAKSIERWENDGTTPFSRSPGGFIQSGCIAPSSIVVLEEAIYWLDHRRRMVRWNGNAVERISTPYDKEIQSWSAISDCIGDHIEFNGQSFLKFHFPAAGKTLVYNMTTEKWSERGQWNSASVQYERWQGNAYCYCPAWGIHLVGDRERSIIYSMASNNFDDAGSELRLEMRTGHLDFGSLKKKAVGELRLRCKRGVGLSTRTPKLLLRWRDDNKRWSNQREISLGDVGDREIVRRIQAQGVFDTRQYEIVGSDPVPIIFLGAEQDVEVVE